MHTTEDLLFLNDFVTANTTAITLTQPLILFAGDHTAASLLARIIYWNSPAKGTEKSRLRVIKNGKLWLAKSHADWREECFVSEGQARRCIEVLRNAGIIHTEIFRFNNLSTNHIWLNIDRLRELNGIYREMCEKCIEEGRSPQEISPDIFWAEVKNRETKSALSNSADRVVKKSDCEIQQSGLLNPAVRGAESSRALTVDYKQEITNSTKNYNKKVGLRPKPEDEASGERVGELGKTVELDTAEKMVVANPIESGNTRNLTGDLRVSGGEQADLELVGETKQVSVAEQITEVFEYWKEVNGISNRRLTKERREKIRARLKTYTVEELKQAIDGAKANGWFNGNNSRGTVYNRIETIFRNDTTTENHIAYAQENPRAKATNKSMLSKNGAKGGIGHADISDRNDSENLNFRTYKF